MRRAALTVAAAGVVGTAIVVLWWKTVIVCVEAGRR